MITSLQAMGDRPLDGLPGLIRLRADVSAGWNTEPSSLVEAEGMRVRRSAGCRVFGTKFPLDAARDTTSGGRSEDDYRLTPQNASADGRKSRAGVGSGRRIRLSSAELVPTARP